MRILSIAVVLVAGFFGARIADDPAAGLATMAVLGAILLLVRRIVRTRRQASPPKRA